MSKRKKLQQDVAKLEQDCDRWFARLARATTRLANIRRALRRKRHQLLTLPGRQQKAKRQEAGTDPLPSPVDGNGCETGG